MPDALRHAVPLELDPAMLEGFDRSANVVTLAGHIMGTGWTVKIAAPSGIDSRAIHAAILARLTQIDGEMSHWKPGSTLSLFNRSTPGSWLPVSAEFITVITSAVAVAGASGGIFDPTIGRLTDLWGLGPNPRESRPVSEAISGALAASGIHHLTIDADRQRLRQPGGLWLDLSGIAKGYAVDALAALLTQSGFRHILVEIGGEWAGRGMRPDGDPWWIELETPSTIALPPLRVALHQIAVATSGNYVRGAHTLDPRTGRPTDSGNAAVSVLHRSAMMADAWATALFVLPPEEAILLADREQLAARIVTNDGREYLSECLSSML